MPEITITNTNEGNIVSVAGGTYRILIKGADTENKYAAIDMLIPPQGGPGPHSHAEIAESFYVVSGEITVKTKEGTFIAQEGSYINIPLGGAVHCFKNNTDKVVHLLCFVVPAGLEAFFLETGKPVSAGQFLPVPIMSKEEKEKVILIAQKFGQTLFPPDYLD